MCIWDILKKKMESCWHSLQCNFLILSWLILGGAQYQAEVLTRKAQTLRGSTRRVWGSSSTHPGEDTRSNTVPSAHSTQNWTERYFCLSLRLKLSTQNAGWTRSLRSFISSSSMKKRHWSLHCGRKRSRRCRWWSRRWRRWTHRSQLFQTP